jgi:betaine-aldehyde dehydrogenase
MSEIARHWIGAEWAGSATVSESVNPATGPVLRRWADGGEAEARAAIAAAPPEPARGRLANHQNRVTAAHLDRR